MATLALFDVVQKVMPCKGAEYTDTLIKQLSDGGAASPSAFQGLTDEQFFDRFSTDLGFTDEEMAELQEVRNYVDGAGTDGLTSFVKAFIRKGAEYIDTLIKKLSDDDISKPTDLLWKGEDYYCRCAEFNLKEYADVNDLQEILLGLEESTRNVHPSLRKRPAPNEKSIEPGQAKRQKLEPGQAKRSKPQLWIAVEQHDEELVTKLLIDHDPEERFSDWTPFIKAAEEGVVNILKALVKAKADKEAVNKNGRSALSFAAAPSNNRATPVEALKYLLEIGCDISHEDKGGKTAKSRAKMEKRSDAVEVIEEFEHNQNAMKRRRSQLVRRRMFEHDQT